MPDGEKENLKIIHVDRTSPKNGPVEWKNNPTLERVVRNLAAAGLPNKDIANLIGVRLSTLERRIRTVPRLEEALIEGRDHATQVMINEMFKTAIGGQITQEIIEQINADGGKVTKVVTRESPPNPQLMMYWLNNRDPVNWKAFRMLQQEAKTKREDVGKAEPDKIARLSRDIFEVDTSDAEGEYSVSEEAPQPTGHRTPDAADVSADVQGETADNFQDDAVDFSAET